MTTLLIYKINVEFCGYCIISTSEHYFLLYPPKIEPHELPRPLLFFKVVLSLSKISHRVLALLMCCYYLGLGSERKGRMWWAWPGIRVFKLPLWDLASNGWTWAMGLLGLICAAIPPLLDRHLNQTDGWMRAECFALSAHWLVSQSAATGRKGMDFWTGHRGLFLRDRNAWTDKSINSFNTADFVPWQH